jgi:hypothetical protein
MCDDTDRPGPTGHFPQGKLRPDDEGEIKVAILADVKHQIVILEFGKPVAYLAIRADQVPAVVEALLQKAEQAQGK